MMDKVLHGKTILLIISGSIAAYKSLDLIRRLRTCGACVHSILTKGGEQFITPLAVSALSGEKTYNDLFSLTDETEMGHIRLARIADLVVVAPASADLLARMAQGRADDLAAAVLLAGNQDILVAPAMNVAMWNHPATQENWRLLMSRGILSIGPESGDMACHETGAGRMAEPENILATIIDYFVGPQRLTGRRALVTSGPTHEPIDPVRYISNRSSGKQGHAIAAALAALGAETTLVSGPTALADPPGVTTIHVETARQMLAACMDALPRDIAVCAAAVSDWRTKDEAAQKIKKTNLKKTGMFPVLKWVENPDILGILSGAVASERRNSRPDLVIGFAAETNQLRDQARAKRQDKGCDWILANDVSQGVFGAQTNQVILIDEKGEEEWPSMTKTQVATRLAGRIADYFAASSSSTPRHDR